MKPRIYIVNSNSFGRHFPRHLERLKEFAEVTYENHLPAIPISDWIRILEPAHAIVASVTPRFGREILSELPRLCAIVRHGLGYDNIDLPVASEIGIAISKVPGPVERESVAEYTVGVMLCLVRHVVAAQVAAARGAWSERGRFIGFELRNRPVGLVGIGNIGGRVAEILRDGFGARVLAHDPWLDGEEISRRGAQPAEFDELISSCDVISLHSSLGEGSTGMIGEREIARMRPGCFLVNTARGELVDQAALIKGLESGHLGGYAADVVSERVMTADHPLLRFRNVLVLPHIGAYTRESLEGMGDSVIADLETIFQQGKIPPAALNASELKELRPWRSR